MELIVDIDKNNNKLEYYDHFLSKFDNWKIYKREIKLNQLLNDSLIEFTVDIDGFNIYLPLNPMDKNESYLTEACSILRKLTFIIENDRVLKLSIDITILTTINGKKLKSLIKDGHQIKVGVFQKENIIRNLYMYV